MSAEPKRVELTEAEKADLIDAFQDGYLMSTDPLTSDLTQLGIVVTRIKAAARREALLEVESRLQPPPPWPASDKKVANDRGYAAGWCDALAVVEEMLAEPERDEEGGMLGGAPGFKYRDATVPVDGEQPGPRTKPRLRACVEAWPGCAEGEYNPACCRFPKSCSCDVYDSARVGPDDLERDRVAEADEVRKQRQG